MEQSNWYAIYTAFRAEKRVKERLDQAGIANYIPLRVVEWEFEDGVKRVEVPLFSGCVFVQVISSELAKVLTITGIVSILQEKKTPVMYSEQQMASLHLLCDRADEIEVTIDDISASSVRIVDGKLTGLEGEYNQERGQVILRLPRVGNVCSLVPENCVEFLK